MSASPALFDGLQDRAQAMHDWRRRRERLLAGGLVIPAVAEPVLELGVVVVPAYGTQALVLAHEVPTNSEAVFTGIVLGYQGSPAPLPGDIVFSVDVDRDITDPATVGYVEKDYGAVPIPLGSLTFIPWPVEFRHSTGEIVRVKATALTNVGTGAPNYFTAALLGFEWPTHEMRG